MEEVRQLTHALQKATDAEPTRDILAALAKAPVTVPILHELKCGALVAKLRKHEDAGVAAAAKALIRQWKDLAAKAGVPATATPKAAPAPVVKTEAPASGSFEVPDLGETARNQARKKLCDLLGEGAAPGDAAHWAAAEAVERAMHVRWPNLAAPDHKKDYIAKLRQLSFNLKKNADLRGRVLRGDVAAKALLEMDADQLATAEVQEERRRMAEYQHDARSLDWQKKNQARIDAAAGIDTSKTMYPCPKCKSTRVSNYEKQTRSADEPMTQFFECIDCGHRWRF